MTLFVNNQPVQKPASTLLGLLEELGFAESKGIAVAVNQQVIRKSSWHEYSLNDNDKITVIRATQGG